MMKACHCDKYGVMHVFTPVCDPTYNGPDKPEPQRLYGPDPIIEAINSLSKRVSDLESLCYERGFS